MSSNVFLTIRHVTDGGVRPFDREQLWVRLYWRPPDRRARILIMTKDAYRRDLHYCTPLNNLKIVRDKSCLQLCRARRDGRYQLWARLNFLLYESKSSHSAASLHIVILTGDQGWFYFIAPSSQ